MNKTKENYRPMSNDVEHNNFQLQHFPKIPKTDNKGIKMIKQIQWIVRGVHYLLHFIELISLANGKQPSNTATEAIMGSGRISSGQLEFSYYQDIIDRAKSIHKKNVSTYKEVHESLICSIQKSLDTINEQKTLMKKYLLLELNELLSNCGLNGDFKDFPYEHIDLRDWNISSDYERLLKDLEISHIDFGVLLAFSGAEAINAMINARKIKQLRKDYAEKCKIAEKYNTDMEADINQISCINMSLENIANIYDSILTSVKQTMRDILIDLRTKYHGDVRKLPHKIEEFLFTAKELLKTLAEAEIMPQIGTKITTRELADCIKSTCDKMTNDYSQLSDDLNNIA